MKRMPNGGPPVVLIRATDLARVPRSLCLFAGTWTDKDGGEYDGFVIGSLEVSEPISVSILERAEGHPLAFAGLVQRLHEEWLWARAQASACEGPKPCW